jgi:hypothetical protein
MLAKVLLSSPGFMPRSRTGKRHFKKAVKEETEKKD